MKDGGPAFPAQPIHALEGATIVSTQEGMSLRDWFAGQALAGLMSGADAIPKANVKIYALTAYKTADAMLAAREGE